MSSTILVVIVLAVMWLVVLVPMFVRRHEPDEALLAAHSAGRMRVLTRRIAPATGPNVAATRPYGYHPLSESDRPADCPAVPASAFSHSRARRRMLRRRRRTLLLLVLLDAAGWYGASHFSAWLYALQVVATVLLIAYLRWLRQQVRRERARRVRRAALSARTASPPFPAPLVSPRPDRSAATSDRPRPESGRIAGPLALAAERGAGAAVTPPATDGTWRPVPVPVPTYVIKPAAHSVDPVVSLDDDDPAFADIDPVVEPVERRRAANG